MKLAGTTAVTKMWAKIKAYVASAISNGSCHALVTNLVYRDGNSYPYGLIARMNLPTYGNTAFWDEYQGSIYLSWCHSTGLTTHGLLRIRASGVGVVGYYGYTNAEQIGNLTSDYISIRLVNATATSDGYIAVYANTINPYNSVSVVPISGDVVVYSSHKYETTTLPGVDVPLSTQNLLNCNASSATKAVQDGNGNVIADRYLIGTRIETSYETNMTGKVVAFGRYYSTGSKSNVHTTFETFITAAGLAWVLSDTPVAYSNRLKSSAWDWEGKGPQGNGTTVKKIATITGLGYVRLEGNNVIGTSMSRSNWRLDISAASSSVIANATTTATVTFGYTYESGVLTLYLGERYGENTYNMFASEAMAGAAITWENSSVAAIARPSGYISI